MNLVERNANRGFGQPVIVGRRLTVFSVIENANIVERIEDYLKDFEVTLEELKSAVAYCKARACSKLDNITDKYCDGCVLRSISEGWTSIKDEYYEVDGISIAKDGMSAALMTLDELEEEEFGVLGWVIAEELEQKILGMNAIG